MPPAGDGSFPEVSAAKGQGRGCGSPGTNADPRQAPTVGGTLAPRPGQGLASANAANMGGGQAGGFWGPVIKTHIFPAWTSCLKALYSLSRKA